MTMCAPGGGIDGLLLPCFSMQLPCNQQGLPGSGNDVKAMRGLKEDLGILQELQGGEGCVCA